MEPRKTVLSVLDTFAPLTQSLPQQSAVPSDEELVARAREGDRRAFRHLVERYEDELAATVVAMLGPTGEVDDVVQDAFIRFYETLDRFRGEAAVSTYLKRIAINRALDALRRRKRLLARFRSRDDETAPAPEPCHEEDRVEARERDRLVHQAIDALPPKYRAVIVLRMIEGYSTEETAEILDIPYGTVLSRLSRAHKKLKDLLTPYIQDHPTAP
jgi:RNA polymerase sigma-70 factor (ECF subfamily)